MIMGFIFSLSFEIGSHVIGDVHRDDTIVKTFRRTYLFAFQSSFFTLIIFMIFAKDTCFIIFTAFITFITFTFTFQ